MLSGLFQRTRLRRLKASKRSEIRQRSEVDPQVVGVEEAMAAYVLEGVEVLLPGLGRLAQDQAVAPAAWNSRPHFVPQQGP